MRLPASLESERALLSCLLLASRDDLSEVAHELLNLPDDLFTTMFNKELFKAVKKLKNDGQPISEILLEDILKSKELNMMDENLLETLVDIMDCMPSEHNAPIHLSRLMRIKERRDKLLALVEHNKVYVQVRDKIINDLNDMSNPYDKETVDKFFVTMSELAQERSEVNEK